MSEADSLIARLGLLPHPEGGYFRETFRDLPPPRGEAAGGGWRFATKRTDPRSTLSSVRRAEGENNRARSTAILFLLKRGEISRWHRVDAAEVWHFYRGAPLQLFIGKDRHILGPDIERGQSPQIVVPAEAWQMARSLGDYTLVGCTVAPGFEFSGFEMAAKDFEP